MVVSGADAAEDISKIRKVFLAIGIGSIKEEDHMKHLYVIRHRMDDSRFGVDIYTDFERGIFCDVDRTRTLLNKKKKPQEVEAER
jgi:hypothetical protein